MFDPRLALRDINFYDELKNEVKIEFEKCGPTESVKIFERNPEGVVAVKYQFGYGAEKCIETMNGRWFDGRKLEADYYDGFSNYYVEETDEEKAIRDEGWSKWLEGNEEYADRKDKEARATAVTPPLEEMDAESD